ncbi:endo alpha-1,4 polygalactosaminidase [Mesonia sp.]|uniref:endo alpha-1,4 polygalactosaminidase n=1 Tax=Mesonia sp. TaxID=1960830 RepID=UPI0025BDB054|nr:endo alpha-1,4 polygalactosaminidase [Mesonia sp.]
MVFSFLLGGFASAQEFKNEVLFCYGDFYPEQIKGYQTVVLEGSHFSKADIEILKKQNKTVLGYISLGEVNSDAAYYDSLKEFTLGKNEIWDSYILDLENHYTSEVLLKLFNEAMQTKGLDGLFLDNVDNYGPYGPTPEKLPALVSFLVKVKELYPEIYLLQNAGVFITDQTQEYINAMAIESVASDYNFKTNKYRLRNFKEFEEQLERLKEIHEQYDLPIILIEYADTKKLRSKILERINPTSWPYFIGGIQLQKLPEFK